jgi:translation initiation factor RLI1
MPAGVVTLPFSVREGINIFLAGFVPTENLRFRDEALTFKVSCMHGWQVERGGCIQRGLNWRACGWHADQQRT